MVHWRNIAIALIDNLARLNPDVFVEFTPCCDLFPQPPNKKSGHLVMNNLY
jgi:hypothetical protein